MDSRQSNLPSGLIQFPTSDIANWLLGKLGYQHGISISIAAIFNPCLVESIAERIRKIGIMVEPGVMMTHSRYGA
jgi:hypothetical protein